MPRVENLLNEFLTKRLDVSQINLGLFIVVLIVLLTALGVCIYLMRKNNLYRRPKQTNISLSVNPKNEVA